MSIHPNYKVFVINQRLRYIYVLHRVIFTYKKFKRRKEPGIQNAVSYGNGQCTFESKLCFK